mmetsp:Transcript_15660/g.51390  ORF Transcript_15660/g.51390 Transcript_15660/m.51390 type:complete len:411 (+) Transcript_15660:22-1254(+)
MLLRLRSRDGLERVQAEESMTLGELKARLEQQLGVPAAQQVLSKSQELLMAKNAGAFDDLADQRRTLKQLGLAHGDLVYFKYDIERDVAPVVKVETREYGKKMTVEDLIARQVVIERQETPHAVSVSFDAHAANAFQAYCGGTLGFNVQRGGLMYGEVGEDNAVKVHFIYEPPQEASATTLELAWQEETNPELKSVEFLAAQLGLKRVGLIFAHSNAERDYSISAAQLKLMAAMQAEGGETFATGVVACVETEDGPAVHFEAFQCSDKAVQLYRDGWFVDPPAPAEGEDAPDPKLTHMKDEVVVMRKDTKEVDNDLFIVPVPILDHSGPLKASFPVENRLIFASGNDLRAALQKHQNKPFVERLSDFHLLLFLSKHLDLQTDMALLTDAVKTQGPIQDGYKLIIESIAGL